MGAMAELRPENKVLDFLATSQTGQAYHLAMTSQGPHFLREFVSLCRKNIGWSWDQKLLNALESFDSSLWSRCDANPMNFVESLSPEQVATISADKKLNEIFKDSSSRLSVLSATQNPHDIAYFCMEFGLTQSVRLYSGGLGILAGDHLKAASDLQWPLCAVGLAYRKGYFSQRLDETGQQHADVRPNVFEEMSMQAVVSANGDRLKIEIPFPGRNVWAQAWQIGVGSVPLYVLDTDIEQNNSEDRKLTDHLYGGDNVHRLHQEMILGIGGYFLLKALGKQPKVYHMNEGHAAFLAFARLEDLTRNQGLKFEEAIEFMKQTSVFTTHTPVPAGHDVFGVDQLQAFVEIYASKIGTTTDAIVALGQLSERHKQQKTFSMTDLALSVSAQINGVSQVHGRVSREMFQEIYSSLPVEEVPVAGVTNGVHTFTWLAQEWNEYFGKSDISWGANFSETTVQKIAAELNESSDESLWSLKKSLKRRFISQLKEHVVSTYPKRGESPAAMGAALANLHEDALIIGFARRFATYKRATLLFQHVEKLEKMIDDGKPIVIVYAGKAHPKDIPGQSFIKEVIEMSRRPKLKGRVIFIENYEMDIARLMVQGVDVWLNTPTRPLEASGTSGMKASINGTLNLSVDDGWWSEAYNGNNGWLIADRKLNEDIDFQLEYDSAQIYATLESDVLPSFFTRNEQGVPSRWVGKMRQSILSTLWQFSTARMLRDYNDMFMEKTLQKAKLFSEHDYQSTKDLLKIRENYANAWDKIAFSHTSVSVLAENKLKLEAKLKTAGLSDKDLYVEAYIKSGAKTSANTADKSAVVIPLKSQGNGNWQADADWQLGGQYELFFRVRPRLTIEGWRQDLLSELCTWN